MKKWKEKLKPLSLAIVVSLLLLAPTHIGSASSTLTNGGFETGDLTGWTVGGSASRVEVLDSTNFEPNIDPPEGTFFALLATGPGIVDLTGIPQGDLDGDGNENYDTSTLTQTFTLTERSVLSFQWCFLTSEGTRAPYDDIFFVELDGTKILTGSVPGGSSPFPDVPPLDTTSYIVSNAGATVNNLFSGRTQFQTFSIELDAGTYMLSFVVADGGDRQVDSGLLIDSLEFSPPPPPPPTLQDLMEKLEALEAKIDEIETKLDDETRFTNDDELGSSVTTITDAISLVQTAITTAIGNAQTVITTVITSAQTAITDAISSAQGVIIGEIDDNEAKIDEIEAKLDDETRFTDDTELSDLHDDLVNNPTHGLEEIKKEVTNIETELADPNHGLEEIKKEVRAIETKLDVIDVEIVPLYKDNIGKADDKKGFFLKTTVAGERVDYDSISIWVDDVMLDVSQYSITKIIDGAYRLEIDKDAVPKKPDIHALIVDVVSGIYKGSGISAIKH